MITVKLHDIFEKRALVTRASARAMFGELRRVSSKNEDQVIIDFSGIDAVTPSFVDETLSVLAETLGTAGWQNIQVVFLNPPTRLSAKFSAVARARGVDISEVDENSWAITAGSPNKTP